MQTLSKLEQAVLKSKMRQNITGELRLDKDAYENWVGVYKETATNLKYTPVHDIAFSFLQRQHDDLQKVVTLGARHLFDKKTDFCLRTIVAYANVVGVRSQFFEDLCDITKSQVRYSILSHSLLPRHYLSFKIEEDTDLDLLREFLVAESIETQLFPASLYDFN